MSLVILIVPAAVIGTLITNALKLASGFETLVYRFALGLSGAALVVLILGSIDLSLPAIPLTVIGLIGLVYSLRRSLRQASREEAMQAQPVASPEEAHEPLGPLEKICAVTLFLALLLGFIAAWAPVTSWDATVAHIALPSDYAREGRIFLHPGNVYSGYPHLMHSLFAMLYYGGGERAVTLFNWSLSLLACGAVFALGRKIADRLTGFVAAALFATAPIFMDQTGGVSIDLAFTLFVTAALCALVAWFDEYRFRDLVIAGLLAGSACGIRHTGYLVCLLFALAVLFGKSRYRIKATFVLSCCAALAALPWLARSAILTGNPVFPFLLTYFPIPSIEHIAITGFGIHESVSTTGGFDLKMLFRFPWDILMRPSQYDGWSKSPGAIIAVLGLPGLYLGGKRARWLGAYSAAGLVFFFFFQRFARYILPFFVPMMVVAALGALRFKPGQPALRALVVVTLAYGLVLHAAAMHFKVPVALGMKSEEAYLSDRVERYEAFQFANRYLNDGVVLTVDQRSYYIDGPTYQNHWGMKNISGKTLRAQRAWLKENNIKYLLLPITYMSESGALADELMPMFRLWKKTPGLLKRIETLEMQRTRSAGAETAEIYEVL